VPVAYVSTVRRLELAPLGDDVHVPDQPAHARAGAAGVQEQQQQQELEHDGPMRVEQPEHAEDEDGEPWQRAREESGGSGRMGGEDERDCTSDLATLQQPKHATHCEHNRWIHT